MTASPQQITATSDSTTSYFRDLDSYPVLRRDEERRHAEQLQSAREAFVALIQELPEDVRTLALGGGGPPVSPRKWPLGQLDACYRRLSEIASSSESLAEVASAARRHKRRIDRAREMLALGNLRLVPMIVNRAGFHRALFLDLVQEGNIGLMEAIDRFEPERGVRFGTYAQWWIRRAILRSVADNRRMITIPVHTARLIRELDSVTQELREALGREPSDVELAGRMDTDPERVRRLRTIVRRVCPLEHSQSADDGANLIDRLPDESVRDPLEDILGQELRTAVARAVERLTPRERSVVRLRFGLDRQLRVSLREIGEVLGISRERVRQIETNALRKISLLLLEEPPPPSHA